MLSPTLAFKVVRDLGPAWTLRRVWFDLQRRSGWLKFRYPIATSYQNETGLRSGRAGPNGRGGLGGHADQPFGHSPHARFFFSPDQFPAICDAASVCAQADRLLAGEWPFFSHRWFKVGFPPDWHRNPLTGASAPRSAHWSAIPVSASWRSHSASEGNGAFGDVKFIWEMSRFSPVFLLARAYAVSREEKYASAFWTLIEDWAEKNPPNAGVNWVCGQEASLRALALCFGLHAFRNAPLTSAERVRKLETMIEAHGRRIESYVPFALAQRNNHGISEAVGLFTIGALFPHSSQSGKWARLVRKLIERQLRDQFYEDGSYIQHSFNYERLVLDEMLWAFRLAEIYEARFSEEGYEILGRALNFLLQFCDPKTGRLPNCGANDGSRFLQLSSCEYGDFRPTLQALHYLVHRKFCFVNGPWNELAGWLFGSELNPEVEIRECFRIKPKSSAYQKLHARESYATLRVPQYRDRPSEADQLHLDLWWRGENIACDPGTYLYSGEPDWDNSLASASVHNTVTIADHEPMTRAGRFLWLDWTNVNSLDYQPAEKTHAIEAAHNGYESVSAKHKRSVLWREDQDFWIVVDDVFGNSKGPTTLQWLFPDLECECNAAGGALTLEASGTAFRCQIFCSQDSQVNLVRAGEVIAGPSWPEHKLITKTRGWRSLVYGDKEPALSLAVRARSPQPIRFVTLLAPARVRIDALSNTEVTLCAELGVYRFRLNPPGEARVFHALEQIA